MPGEENKRVEYPDYVHCVLTGLYDIPADAPGGPRAERKTWCGREGAELAHEWLFMDPTHAALNGKKGGRLVACPECAKAIAAAVSAGCDEAKRDAGVVDSDEDSDVVDSDVVDSDDEDKGLVGAGPCEHGCENEAPAGKRFCSPACEACEHESKSVTGCDGICFGPRDAEVESLRATIAQQMDLASRHTALGEMNGDEADQALTRLVQLALEPADKPEVEAS